METKVVLLLGGPLPKDELCIHSCHFPDSILAIYPVSLFAKNPVFLFTVHNPLANIAEQRVLDIPLFLQKLNEFEEHDIPNIFIDGSMLPCFCTEYFDLLKYNNKLFYIESCSKYLQFGLDMGMAGVVVHDVKLKPQMNRLRRNMGLNLTEYTSRLFPQYDINRFNKRIQRIENNALQIATLIESNKKASEFWQVIYPGLPSHPDYSISSRYARYGGCVTFKPKGDKHSFKDKLDVLIDRILHEGQKNNLPIVKGVSFGFSVHRLCAASAMAENTPPFLRLSVGDQYEETNRSIGHCILNVLQMFS